MTHPHLTIEQLRERNRILIEEERAASKGATSLWYLSYASEEKFLGGVIVRAFGFIHACQRARDLGISGNGQIRGVPVPSVEAPPAKYLDKLLTLAELEECWGKMHRLSDLEAGR